MTDDRPTAAPPGAPLATSGEAPLVVAAEPDARIRARMSIALAGIAATPAATLAEAARGVPEGRPAVMLLGPGFATVEGFALVTRFTRARPHVGVVLLGDDLDLEALRAALRAGVRDVVALDSGEVAVRQAVTRTLDAVGAITRGAAGAAAAERAPRGRVVVAFSTKGGVGKSVISTNVAVALAALHPGGVVIVDADLQFGDVAVLLGLPPVHTTVDAPVAVANRDHDVMDRVLAHHDASGLRVLCAPIDPAAGEHIDAETMVAIVRLLREMFAFVVIDMPPHFDDVVLALLEEADEVLLVASMDIPSIKNLKVGIQTLDLLSVAGSKVRLVLNRANAKVNLDVSDVERALATVAEFRIPSDIAVPQAVNRGVPVVLDRPRAAASAALRSLAQVLDAPPTAATPAAKPRTRHERSHRRRRND